MYLDYSKLEFDRDGNPEMPELVLKTLGDRVIGVIPGVHNLKLNIKYSEPSEISFDIPAKIDDLDNPLYDAVTGYKQIYTKCYGVYEILNPSIDSDGISEIKHVKGYSYEKTLESKKFFLEEGTFNFWNPASPTDTVLGRILEVAIGWSAGYVSPSLIGRYRTFDDYNDYLLSFVYSNAPEKYRCVFVFDTYDRTINVYDAGSAIDGLPGEDIGRIPIYLSFENLIESIDVTEKSDELATAIRPYGADDLDIRAVNPIGTNWIYDLSYFISNGDISESLADKWNIWQRSVIDQQMYYKGLVALQASSTARILAEQAQLADLKGELDTLTAQQSVTIQALAMETTSAGISSQQALLDSINAKITAKNAEISEKESVIASIQSELDSYTEEIKAVVSELSIKKFFTDEEYEELSHFMIEQDITENTFVASTLDTSVSGSSYTMSNESVTIQGSSISMVDLTDTFSKKMYVMAGGTFALSGTYSISGDIIRGTLETKKNGSFVMSFYAGTICVNDKTAPSGMITINGTYSGLSSDIGAVTIDEVTTFEGTTIQFTAQSGSMFLTANVSDYQKYSVQMELYDYAVKVLSDLATPTYEFSVESGNFLFEQEFEPFRNQLELGKGVYLKIGDFTITPYIIEFEVNFEDRSSFSIVFSNRFKRHDVTNTLKDMIETSYSTSRSFDSSKYVYNQATSQAATVSKFMSDSLDAAKNTILGAANQSIVINGSGIHVGGDSKYQLRLVDRMLAMTDDNWDHAKLAIGLFSSPEVGEYFGVNAEVIGGKLIVGNNLVIENETDRGVMQFKVDATGAWLNNATFILQSDSVSTFSTYALASARSITTGGKIILDPNYGIVAGTGDLFTTYGTTVIPSFIDDDGDITFDSDGMPKNANFYVDIRDGSAYFRGKLNATAGGFIGGFTIEDDYLHAGNGSNYVAINGSGTNTNSLYAFWAGAVNPSSAPFWVKKNGDISVRSGTFRGTIYGASFQDSNGNSMMNSGYQFTASYLNLNGINVGNGNFVVDASGNVTVKGSITMASGSYINWAQVTNQNINSNPAYTAATGAQTAANNAQSTANSAQSTANSALSTASSALTAATSAQSTVSAWCYYGTTYIDGSKIMTGTVQASKLKGGSVSLLDYWENTAGVLTITSATSGAYAVDLTSYAALRFTANSGNLHLGAYYNATWIQLTNSMINTTGSLVSNNGSSLGTSYYKWGEIYSWNSTIQTSDLNEKTSIQTDLSKYDGFFDCLKPSSFKFINGQSGRRHIGFIAQEVERSMFDNGISDMEFAGFIRSPMQNEDGTEIPGKYTYGLRYGEFIPLCVDQIQRLKTRISELEAKIDSMN